MIQTSQSTFFPSRQVASNPPHWYAVQTRSRFERVVRAELEGFGIEHYLPTLDAVRQWKDRRKVVQLPLFPGYIFARFQDVAAARLQVLRANGVVRILGTGAIIEPVPSGELDSIRRLLQCGRSCFPHSFVAEGDWVRVRRGVLSGLEGRLVRSKSQARLVLSVELLSQSVATEVDACDVEAAPDRNLRRQPESAGRIS